MVQKQWDYCCHVLICMVKTMVCSSLQQSAVCTDWKVDIGYGMPKIAIEIMGLSTNLDWEDGIDENYWVPSR